MSTETPSGDLAAVAADASLVPDGMSESARGMAQPRQRDGTRKGLLARESVRLSVRVGGVPGPRSLGTA